MSTEQSKTPNLGIGPAPSHLSEGARAVWDELATELPRDVATARHRVAFEALVYAVGKIRTGEASPACLSQARQLLESFGLLPDADDAGKQERERAYKAQFGIE